MTKDPRIFLKHILESMAAIEDHVRGMDRSEFLLSTKTQDAVIRRLEIIGEAAVQLPESFREKHSAFSWSDLIGMRNVMIHQYSRVNMKLVWEAITKDLPKFRERLEKLL